MTAFEAYKTGNVPGPMTAAIVSGEVAGEMIKSAENPLFVVGSLILKEEAGGKNLSDFAVEIARKLTERNFVTIATSNSGIVFKGMNISVKRMGVVELVDRLQNPDWGANGKPHDLIVFLGIHYWLASQGLSTLKHFAPHLKTLTLCYTNHPNANWSFPNMDKREWGKALNKIILKI